MSIFSINSTRYFKSTFRRTLPYRLHSARPFLPLRAQQPQSNGAALFAHPCYTYPGLRTGHWAIFLVNFPHAAATSWEPSSPPERITSCRKVRVSAIFSTITAAPWPGTGRGYLLLEQASIFLSYESSLIPLRKFMVYYRGWLGYSQQHCRHSLESSLWTDRSHRSGPWPSR